MEVFAGLGIIALCGCTIYTAIRAISGVCSAVYKWIEMRDDIQTIKSDKTHLWQHNYRLASRISDLENAAKAARDAKVNVVAEAQQREMRGGDVN